MSEWELCTIILYDCFLSQARGHSTALSAGPPSRKRETFFATSNCTPGRSLSNARCAAMPAVDAMPWAGTCAPILVRGSHIHSHVKLILYAPVYSIVLVGFSLLHVGFSLLLNLNTCPACMAFPVTTCHALGLWLHIWHLTHFSLETYSFTFSSRVLPADTLHGHEYAHHQFCMKPQTQNCTI